MMSHMVATTRRAKLLVVALAIVVGSLGTETTETGDTE